MYIFKNAITSITRNKGRNILLGIIIMVIGCSVTVTLAIRQSANKLIEAYANKYDVEATISVNRQNMMKNFSPDDTSPDEMTDEEKQEKMGTISNSFSEASNLTIEQIENYADSDYVKSYYYTETLSMNSDSIEKASSSFGNGDHNMPNTDNKDNGDFTLQGYNSIDSMTGFLEGNYKMIEGSISSDLESYTCVVNSELAELNNISVGDSITFLSPNDTSKTYTLEVTGIFEEQEENGNTEMSMFSQSTNTIITNTKVVENINKDGSEHNFKITPTFILTSKDVIDNFSKEVSDKGLSEYLTVSTNLETIASATSSVSNLKTFATTFLIISLIIGVIVLLILNSINIRERKYEIGVLRTIGMKKSLLTGQFVIELLIVTLVSLTIGAGIGSAISVPISNQLLNSEISSSKNEMNEISNNFGGGNQFEGDKSMKKISGVASIQAYDSIDAAVDFNVLLKLYLIGIVLTLISSLSSMISIQKFSPLQILKERS